MKSIQSKKVKDHLELKTDYDSLQYKLSIPCLYSVENKESTIIVKWNMPKVSRPEYTTYDTKCKQMLNEF